MCGNFLGYFQMEKMKREKIMIFEPLHGTKIRLCVKNLEAFRWKNKISYTWLLSVNFKTEVRKTYFCCHGTWTVQQERCTINFYTWKLPVQNQPSSHFTWPIL